MAALEFYKYAPIYYSLLINIHDHLAQPLGLARSCGKLELDISLKKLAKKSFYI